MRRAGILWKAAMSALFACGSFAACTYDFDSLVAEPAGSGGTAGIGGSGGAGGPQDDGSGTGGAAGTGDDGSAGSGGTAGSSGTGGASGKGGTGGIGGSDAGVDAGKGGNAATDAGKSGNAGADAGADRIADARTEAPPFDCNAVNGMMFQNHCYYATTTMTSWDTANMTGCASPSHLVVITSQAEQNFVAGIASTSQRWIGLRKDPGSPNMESSFHWVTAEALSFKTWEVYDTGAPEPNYTGDCVRMQASGRWGDTNCADNYISICERE